MRFLWSALLTSCFKLVSCLTYCLILKLETTYSYEKSVDFQRTIRRHISEDRTFIKLSFFVLYSCVFFFFLSLMLALQLVIGLLSSHLNKQKLNYFYYYYLSPIELNWISSSSSMIVCLFVYFLELMCFPPVLWFNLSLILCCVCP
jgi:hypothetical protein